MNEPDFEHFQHLLEQRREELLAVAETAEAAADTVELDQTRVGRVSRMDAMQAQAMSLENQRRRELELKRIAAALSRIKAGDYGYCVECDSEIALNRLEFAPSAPLCIDCASRAEAP